MERTRSQSVCKTCCPLRDPDETFEDYSIKQKLLKFLLYFIYFYYHYF
jgi:hypothetical protein